MNSMPNSEFSEGTKVHYIPFKDCDPSQYENGIIKRESEDKPGHYFVVYHCNNEWDNYKDYTAALTDSKQLRADWI